MVLTEGDVRALTDATVNGSPIVSCYLDVDGAVHHRCESYERVFERLVAAARAHEDAGPDIGADLARVESRVRQGFDRSWVRGVAMFSHVDSDLFVVHQLPTRVRSEITLNPRPVVGQLELALQRSRRLGVLAIDRQHARVLVFRHGEALQSVAFEDHEARHYDEVGEADRGTVDDHREAMVKHHLRRGVDSLWEVFQDFGFEDLALVASSSVRGEVEQLLHPYLRSRLGDDLPVDPKASLAELRAAAEAAEARIAARREQVIVDEFRAVLAQNGRAVAGIEDTIDAINEHRVDQLLVSDGFQVTGWHCPECNRLALVGRSCQCGSDMVHVPDLVAEAVDVALGHSTRVDVCTSSADLDVAGRIGAVLRF